jgi:hypothetical protein
MTEVKRKSEKGTQTNVERQDVWVGEWMNETRKESKERNIQRIKGIKLEEIMNYMNGGKFGGKWKR